VFLVGLVLIVINNMDDCIFCEIVAGQASAEKVYEDDYVIAIMDIFPAARGHVLVIPKVHSVGIFDMAREDALRVFGVAHDLAGAVRAASDADGLNIYMNNGEAAGQIVMHPHVHLIPRFEGDGHKAWGKIERSEEELALDAERIRGYLAK